mmetsp:Transcript_40676/g.66550  ORF Transcript_40676/g.66550 Transcript_40676/m.66550 type:complete len:424 (+) Transcript_40676:67-1338(+)
MKSIDSSTSSVLISQKLSYLKLASKKKLVNLFADELAGTFKTKPSDRITRIKLSIQYCNTDMQWVLVVDSKSTLPPDLIPQQVPGVDDIYQVFDLGEIESLESWDSLGEDGLYLLAMDIRNCYRRHQVKKVREMGFQEVENTLDALQHREQSVDVLVDPMEGTVRLRFPLWDETTEAKEDLNKAPSFMVDGCAICLDLTYRIESLTAGRSTPDHVEVSFPHRMKTTKNGFILPPWQAGTSMFDYLPLVRRQAARRWAFRREVVRVLAKRCASLEFDAVDYSSIHILVQVTTGETYSEEGSMSTSPHIADEKEEAVSEEPNKNIKGKLGGMFRKKTPKGQEPTKSLGLTTTPPPPPASLVRIIQFVFTHTFPESVPGIIIHDNFSQQYWSVGTQRYNYNPRWAPEQMAEELYKFACGEVPKHYL